MQMVEQGKLDLDRDVNTYLDFHIPDRPDGPITLRNIMTHTPGFEEQIKSLITSDVKGTRLPRRLRAQLNSNAHLQGRINTGLLELRHRAGGLYRGARLGSELRQLH